jgi:hypothetical protein
VPPIFTWEITENPDPILQKLRTLMLEAKLTQSKTLHELFMRTIEIIDNPLPSRTKERKLTAEPRATPSSTLMVEPNLAAA